MLISQKASTAVQWGVAPLEGGAEKIVRTGSIYNHNFSPW